MIHMPRMTELVNSDIPRLFVRHMRSRTMRFRRPIRAVSLPCSGRRSVCPDIPARPDGTIVYRLPQISTDAPSEKSGRLRSISLRRRAIHSECLLTNCWISSVRAEFGARTTASPFSLTERESVFRFPRRTITANSCFFTRTL